VIKFLSKLKIEANLQINNTVLQLL